MWCFLVDKSSLRHLIECVVVPFSTWCDACKQIMIGLPPMIDCLLFFLLFSFLTIKMHNCSLYLLFVKLGMFVIPKFFGFDMVVHNCSLCLLFVKLSMFVMAVRPKTKPPHLRFGIVCKTRALGSMLDLGSGLATIPNPGALGLTLTSTHVILVWRSCWPNQVWSEQMIIKMIEIYNFFYFLLKKYINYPWSILNKNPNL